MCAFKKNNSIDTVNIYHFLYMTEKKLCLFFRITFLISNPLWFICQKKLSLIDEKISNWTKSMDIFILNLNSKIYLTIKLWLKIKISILIFKN